MVSKSLSEEPIIQYQYRLFISYVHPSSSQIRDGKVQQFDLSMAPSEILSRLVSSKGYQYEILADRYIDVQFSTDRSAVNSIHALESIRLDVEYTRELTSQLNQTASTPFPQASLASSTTRETSSAMRYLIRLRLSSERDTDIENRPWDIEFPIDLSKYIRFQSGQAFASYIGSSLDLNDYGEIANSNENRQRFDADEESSCLGIDLTQITFDSKGSLSSYPAASTFTMTRYPETAIRLESLSKRFRMFMNLKLNFNFPETFRVVMDIDSIACYGRMFSMLVKVCLSSLS